MMAKGVYLYATTGRSNRDDSLSWQLPVPTLLEIVLHLQCGPLRTFRELVAIEEYDKACNFAYSVRAGEKNIGEIFEPFLKWMDLSATVEIRGGCVQLFWPGHSHTNSLALQQAIQKNPEFSGALVDAARIAVFEKCGGLPPEMVGHVQPIFSSFLRRPEPTDAKFDPMMSVFFSLVQIPRPNDARGTRGQEMCIEVNNIAYILRQSWGDVSKIIVWFLRAKGSEDDESPMYFMKLHGRHHHDQQPTAFKRSEKRKWAASLADGIQKSLPQFENLPLTVDSSNLCLRCTKKDSAFLVIASWGRKLRAQSLRTARQVAAKYDIRLGYVRQFTVAFTDQSPLDHSTTELSHVESLIHQCSEQMVKLRAQTDNSDDDVASQRIEEMVYDAVVAFNDVQIRCLAISYLYGLAKRKS